MDNVSVCSKFCCELWIECNRMSGANSITLNGSPVPPPLRNSDQLRSHYNKPIAKLAAMHS